MAKRQKKKPLQTVAKPKKSFKLFKQVAPKSCKLLAMNED